MSELTVESGPLRGQTLLFSAAEPFVVGSGADCSLRLEGPGVADQHLVIKALKGGGFGVKKIGASFLLNGQNTEAARLNDGDLLEVGGIRMRIGPPQDNGTEVPNFAIEGYSLRSVLGKGGHGTVYRAEQLSLHREIALKVLNKDMTRNPEFVGRFVAEARAAARLSHPNVVQVFDVGHDGDTYYLSMEIMEHGSLEDRLRSAGRIPVESCLGYMIDAAKGLAYAESMRIVHRDIKPDNIMVDGHEVAKIADLGLAMSDDEEQGRIVGTPHFMSPEQVLNKPVDHRSDLYSLGCTFFRLVTGRTLFQGRTTKEILTAHVKHEPESADAIDDAIPGTVAEIIDRLVEKDPDDRYQSAAELIEDLQRAMHPPARTGLWIAAIAVLVLAAGYAIYWGVTKPDGSNGKPKIVKVTDPALQKELREAKALAEFTAIGAAELSDLQRAERLEAFSKHPDFAGTKAAADAITRAGKLRARAADRARQAAAQAAAVEVALVKVTDLAQKAIDEGRYQAAAAALQPKDLAPEILKAPRMQERLAALRGQLTSKGKQQLEQWKAAVEKASTARDPEAITAALAPMVKALDAKDPAGWPALMFEDRRNEASFVADAQRTVRQLTTELASTRDTRAWANYHRQVLGEQGILAKMAAFDTAGALAAATTAQAELASFKAGAAAAQLLAVVTAAKAYEDAFQKAVAAGKVRVPVAVDGAITDVRVKAFQPTGQQAGMTVQIRKSGKDQDLLLPLAELRGRRLAEVFLALDGADGKHAANRLAFLALHALPEHLGAATTYMQRLDPKVATSGTGSDRFQADIATLNIPLKGLSRVSPLWGEFLRRELRAARELSRGLRAFSRLQFTVAQGHFEDLDARFKGTLAVMSAR